MRIDLAFPSALLGAAVYLVALAPAALAETPVEFQKHVLPVLKRSCIGCHGEKKQAAKLDLRTVKSMQKGGVSGPAIEPGDAKKSLLIELIHYNEMPPKKAEGPRVGKDELELLRRWIDAGAIGPGGEPNPG